MHKGQRPPLPPSKDGFKEHVTHIYEPEQLTVNELPQPVEVPEITFEEQPENRIDVSDTSATLHQHIAEAKSQLKKNKPDNYGRVSTYWKRGNDISVFPESIERALLLMNALVERLGNEDSRYRSTRRATLQLQRCWMSKLVFDLKNGHARFGMFRLRLNSKKKSDCPIGHIRLTTTWPPVSSP